MNPLNEELQPPKDVWAMASSLSNPTDADVFFHNFSESIQISGMDDAYARGVLGTAIRTLMAATRDEPKNAEEIIARHVLPVCLERSCFIDFSVADPDAFRDHLSAWIEQYPDEQKVPLRTRVMTETLKALRSGGGEPAIWTISAIGLRSPDIEEALKSLTRRNDPTGDAALGCLAGLSPSDEIKKTLISRVVRRLSHRKPGALGFAIQELSSPRFIPSLIQRLLPSEGNLAGVENDGDWEQLRAMGFLGRIAEREPNNRPLQRRIWLALRRATQTGGAPQNSILLSAHAVASCNTPDVTTSLLSLLAEPGANLFLICQRLQGCILPEQLLGWHKEDTARLRMAISHTATVSTGGQSASRTVESHLRSLVWEVAYAAGITDLDEWFEILFRGESNPYGLSEMISFASYVRLLRVPSRIAELVRERVDVKHGGTEPLLGARIAATQVLRAASSTEAFDVLLDSGLTFQGSSLRRIGEAVADVAESLSRQHLEYVVSRLFDVSEVALNEHRRTLALVGLQRLAAIKALPESVIPRFINLAHDKTLPAYARVYAVWSLGCFQAANATAAVDCLLTYADDSESDAELRFQSLDALMRLGKWDDYQQRFLRALSIPSLGETIPIGLVVAYKPWQALILANLFLLRPEAYHAAATEVISHGRGEIVHIMLQVLGNGSAEMASMVGELAQTAIKRTKDRLGRSFGETDNFDAMWRMAPDKFVSTNWQGSWGDWMPDVRASLAEALEGPFPQLLPEHRLRVFDMLETLLGDSTYQVRRSAGRTYSRLDVNRFAELAQGWVHSGSTELRRRAAEMAQWLPLDDEVVLDNQTVRTLSHDPEPSVRKTAVRSREDLRRRIWRNMYLDRILQERSEDGNLWISRVYCYGRALAKIGDDETLRAIRDLGSKEDVPPNVQNWLRSVGENLESNWRDVTRSWPDPWLPWSGQLEDAEGRVSIGGDTFEGRISLWYQRQDNPQGTSSWGGAFQMSPGFHVVKYIGKSNAIHVAIEGRKTASAVFNGIGSDGLLIFVGSGPYPEAV